ncbi:MAG: signal peptide peptidase SppA [Bacteroidales bacterium]|nr:signal peptide peptidase SppA [Bacteroidales bacterium]
MKEFVKTMLAVICALIVLRILAFFLMIIMFAGAIAGGSGVPLPKEGVLDVDMSKFIITEQTQENPVPSFSMAGMQMPVAQIGLLDAINGIEAAAADPGVKYILLRAEGASMGMSDAEEFRRALSEFRRSGKPVIAWLESPANGSYYLSTVADKIYLSSYHGFSYQLIGISSQMMFVKDILDKLGVNVQLIRHGKYKSAGEMFIRSSASPENREQNQVMVNSAWKVMTAAISEARDISPEKFNALVDNLALAEPEDFLSNGLVDGLMTRAKLVEKLCTLAGVESEEKLKLIPFADYAIAKVKPVLRPNVAIIYADGDIVDGDDDLMNVAGDRFVREINKAANDDAIKAVVLRVNSPGGSVAASVKIKTALDSLQARKPLVASFGNYAASGGYWISNGCEKIYADANTITGSIGVFSMIPEFSKVTKKVGVNFESVGSNKHSDMYSLMRPFDKAELDYQQASVEDIYESFVNLVADGRKMAPSAVDAIAQGRVWMGSDALGIGLVDEIGTLQDAIAYAATLAGIAPDDARIAAFPAPLTFAEQLMESLGQSNREPSILAGTPFEAMSAEVSSILSAQPGKPMARMPYAYEIK